MEGGPNRALVDAYRARHGYERQEFSWYLKRGERRVGRRFDHAFCSRDHRRAIRKEVPPTDLLSFCQRLFQQRDHTIEIFVAIKARGASQAVFSGLPRAVKS